jgi:hypothetical protein
MDHALNPAAPPDQSDPPASDIRRAFREWFAMADTRCALPMVLEDHDGSVEISILTNRSKIPAFVSDQEATVYAVVDDECWDWLLSLDVSPQQLPDGGWVCGECRAHQQQVFASLELLWADHLFEPLTDWINTDLARATAMVLCRSGGATWARLVTVDGAPSAEAHVVVPL